MPCNYELFSHNADSFVKKGDEKGYFEFGGSTVVLVFQKGKIRFDEDLLRNTREGFETKIFMGEKIGTIKILDN